MTQVPEDRRQLFIEAQSQASEEESSIVVSVTDSGIGVKPDDLPKLFQADPRSHHRDCRCRPPGSTLARRAGLSHDQ
jgi:signal transduction histidine kinase